ncbi:hypothetical protein B7R21_15660 [Subtercola boreus]|uniref:HTH lacI-type domain-containing protein n=1 Tax=Subtercola boreus TaxID=120213 RepID=A0A3E0VCJ9_9MICO|nr:LacI family DNA-binding transcriptional regulator [Subtercola boreus]RFA07614.1 hypothetical protein B7R21_15660 [Subtercola boreus]
MAKNSGASTIVDVAERAGVSRQTVTRALNDMVDVSAATRARVIAAAMELNYRPNRAAQNMVHGRRRTVGLVLEDLSNPYFAELASALSRAAAERGWSVLLCDIGGDREKGRAQLASIVAGVDALTLTGCNQDTMDLLPEAVLRGGALGLPLLMLDGADHARLNGRIVLDVDSGITAALDHLVATGRRRIAFIDSESGPDDRRKVYRAYLEGHDLVWPAGTPEISAEESIEGGMEAAEQLVLRAPDVDAALVYNDVMAIGVLKAMSRLHRRVPEDVAVVGIDGLQIGRFVTPELTTLSIDKGELADVALDVLDRLLAGNPAAAGEAKVIGLSLVVREST